MSYWDTSWHLSKLSISGHKCSHSPYVEMLLTILLLIDLQGTYTHKIKFHDTITLARTFSQNLNAKILWCD